MSGVKNYLKQETQCRMLGLEHQKTSDFYLSVWQTNRSPVPLLVVRTVLFLSALSLALSSMIYYMMKGTFAYWVIYFTHWGLTAIVFVTGFSLLVSARIYFIGPLISEFEQPWYVKTQWVLYNSAIPVAFLITIFYWTILYEAGIKEEYNQGVDIAVHVLNSIIMFLLLITSSQPSRLAHVYQPLLFSFVYMLFSLFYYIAGGKDQLGNPYVYDVVYWANPGQTIGVVALTGLLLVLIHFLTMGLAALRDYTANKCINPSVKVYIDEEMALRTRPN